MTQTVEPPQGAINPSENPHNRTTHPKEYQAWYYQYILKPRRHAINGLSPDDYFTNKRPYTYKQKQFNRMNRTELIEKLLMDHDYYSYRKHMNYKYKEYSYTRTRAEAKAMAEEMYQEDLEWTIKDESSHRILNIIDKIKEHPAFNTVEAFTLLELTYRWTFSREDMPYTWKEPEITVTQQELFDIVSRTTLLDPISPIKQTNLSKNYMKYLGKTVKIEEYCKKHNEWVAEYRDKAIQNALRALSYLKTDWLRAVNEADTHLIWNHRGTRHIYENTIQHQRVDWYDYLWNPSELELEQILGAASHISSSSS